MSCLRGQTELVRPSGIQRVCDHSLSVWNWTLNGGQAAEHAGPSPEGADTSRVPPSGSAAGMQLCLQAPAFPSAPVLPLKQTPELRCAKGNQGKGVSFVLKGLRLREKRAQWAPGSAIG